MMKTASIPRPLYRDRLMPYVGKGLIKTLTGQRRVGKSCILKNLEAELRETNPDANFIVVNLEDFAFAHITDAEALHQAVTSKISEGRRNFIFIDEVQEVRDFDKVLRSLYLDPNNDLYVTGSNSSMLSSEIASRLAGRSVEIRVHPLGYGEYLVFHGETDSEDSLDSYLRYGGMPYLRNLPDRETWNEYLAGVADALVYRDVVARHNIRNNDFLQRLLVYLARNTGQLFTAKSIADYLKSQRLATTVGSVQAYADYLCSAYIINKVRRWDIIGKKYFEISEKYFFEDIGIRNAVAGYRPGDIGGIMENAIYNHLRIRGYDVKIGVLAKGCEIDFVATRNNERLYIQAAVNVNDPDTARREFGNLERIPDNYRKIVVTRHDSAPNTQGGIAMMSLRQFLNTTDCMS